MRIYKPLFFSALLFLMACGGSAPDGILEKKKMTDVLTEIHIVDGGTYDLPQLPDTMYKYALPKYLGVFKKYGTDTVQFKNSFTYYAHKPEELDAIYDDVLKKLQQKIDSMSKIKPETLKAK